MADDIIDAAVDAGLWKCNLYRIAQDDIITRPRLDEFMRAALKAAFRKIAAELNGEAL